jgi:hypothetical protein
MPVVPEEALKGNVDSIRVCVRVRVRVREVCGDCKHLCLFSFQCKLTYNAAKPRKISFPD